ncbi:olee1-like protein [Prosopis cineraria]|uniref:olee1-like protein n=1 Tax=Prosopis cineraria TaxID=364024 RepID=UPI00240F9548|nr:olee1-like protein [Prosopis cineraria]
MAKSNVFITVSSVLCLLFSCSANGQNTVGEELIVQGTVYCDTCDVQFVTRLSEPIVGATVRLKCMDSNNPKNITLEKEGTTDQNGQYRIVVDGDHAEEVCEVVPIKSSKEDCAEWDESKHLQQSAKISITNKNGIKARLRNASPMGFSRKQPLPECPQALKEIGLKPDGTVLDE